MFDYQHVNNLAFFWLPSRRILKQKRMFRIFMFSNYFKTAWRNIVRGKVYSLLNLLGLATGMAVALLIGLWVHYQLSYDRFVAGYEQAYQVRFNYSDEGVIRNQAEVCLPLGDAMKKDIPEVAYVAP